MNKIKFIDITEIDEGLKEKVRQWRNRAWIRKSMLTQHIITRREHLKLIESLKQRNDWKFWVIFVNNIPIGSVSIKDINYGDFTAEWGFYIGEKDYRGKGLSRRILFKLLEIFFDEMRFKTLFTKVLSNNVMALNLYKKFRFEQIDKFLFKGKREAILLKFSREDWIKFKPTLRNECYKNKE
jgi:UDP-4-amino-4,6-dideoxy-N-acetyl-beta-L-altrosamine N-acetyltransferase